MTDAEKQKFENVYVNYLNSSLSTTTSESAYKKIRQNAWNYAKAAVIKGRG